MNFEVGCNEAGLLQFMALYNVLWIFLCFMAPRGSRVLHPVRGADHSKDGPDGDSFVNRDPGTENEKRADIEPGQDGRAYEVKSTNSISEERSVLRQLLTEAIGIIASNGPNGQLRKIISEIAIFKSN